MTAPGALDATPDDEASARPQPGDAPDHAAAITGLTDLLVKAVRALGAAGQADQASRLAAKAWWVLKDWPRQAERVNGTMHYLARLPEHGDTDPEGHP